MRDGAHPVPVLHDVVFVERGNDFPGEDVPELLVGEPGEVLLPRIGKGEIGVLSGHWASFVVKG